MADAIRECGWGDLLDLAESGTGSDDAERAWAEIHRRLTALVRMARRGVPGLTNEDCEDVVHHILIRLRAESRFANAAREARSAYAYLMRVVRNTAIDVLRKRRYLVPLETSGGVTVLPEADLLIAAVVDALPQEERDLLRKRYWENMTIAEIAAEAGLSYSVIAKRLFRIVDRLRHRMRYPPGAGAN